LTRRGKELTVEYNRMIREWRDAMPVLYRCLFCDDFHEGTLAEGRTWHEEHRRRQHPEAHSTTRRRSRATNTIVQTSTDIDTAIARVRQQGGHQFREGEFAA